MNTKQCFKCAKVLVLSEFYPHKQMGDGHLNKCKECTKKDTAQRATIKSQDLEWIISERHRHREKSRNARQRGLAWQESAKTKANWCKRNPHKKKASDAINNAIRASKIRRQPCMVCGDQKAQGHHEDYTRPLDVHWLCTKHHGERHVCLNEYKLRGRQPPKIEDQFGILILI